MLKVRVEVKKGDLKKGHFNSSIFAPVCYAINRAIRNIDPSSHVLISDTHIWFDIWEGKSFAVISDSFKQKIEKKIPFTFCIVFYSMNQVEVFL